ncbi:GNAT family N-acetyltransferase [Leucothrix sargassi]|nr:GNAT family N-acetyltransferase [Leucothrix sargassi]
MSSKLLTTRIVSNPQEFESLSVAWNELYEFCNDTTIFCSWDWLFTWWMTFGECDDRDLFILCFYDGDQLVSIAPFQIERKYPHTYIQGRTLRFIASGEKREDGIATPFVDILVREGYEDQTVKAVEVVVQEHQKRWNFAEFEYLLKDSLIFKCFKQQSQGINQQVYSCGYRYEVPAVETKADYLATLARRWQKDYRKKDRLFQKDGVLSVKNITLETLDEFVDMLKDMHRDRWQDRADFLVFESTYFNGFHRSILKRLIPQGKAYIRILYLDDTPMSCYYAFEDKGQVHYYQSAFYKENANRYMPLFYLVCNEIGAAMEQGKRFDFMFDSSDASYKKQQYAAEKTPMYRLVWTSSRYRLGVFNLYKSVKHSKVKDKALTLLTEKISPLASRK